MNGREGRRLLAILFCVPVALFAIGWLGGFRINFTPSYPLGVWRIIPIDREPIAGDLVFICPPETDFFALAYERGYIRKGLCPSGYSPLIKTVMAGSGQNVVIGDAVAIDGLALAHSQLERLDSRGRTLPPSSGGIIPPDYLYVHSDFAGSYDSRYFGPIPAQGLLGLARPVLTVSP